MTAPVKCRKLVDEVSDGEHLDTISSLPDGLIGHILSFLPTKFVVGTSLLSTRWRHLFRSTNSLDFDDEEYLCGPLLKENIAQTKESFKMFVYKILALHTFSPLKKFRLYLTHDYRDSHHSWISAAMVRRVQELDIQFNASTLSKVLPSSLFNCKTLVILKIRSSSDFKVPESVCLPRLKVLHLHDVNFSDVNSVSRFFSCSSLLEELILSCCCWTLAEYVYIYAGALKYLTITGGHIDNPAVVEIDAPGLAYLTCTCIESDDDYIPYYLSNSRSLLKARLQPGLSCWRGKSIFQSLKLIRGTSSLKKLCLLRNSLWGLAYVEDHGGEPKYPNLTTLHLGRCYYDSWRFLTYWLANSPQLETVVFEEGLIECREREWPANAVLVPFSSHVKKIEVYRFYGSKEEQMVLEYLLKSARELTSVILYKPHHMTTEQDLRVISTKWRRLPRSSECCCIQLKPEPNPSSR